MTATPIPRTLTLTYYGEMEVSRLDEMPPGRQPIQTVVMSAGRIDEVVNGLARHLESGQQAYWVCPLVEESENSDQAAAEARAEQLRMRFGDRVGLVHGRMKGPEKDAAMAAFSADRTKVLVATTVIEVGVDVPNASLIIIEGADRFGLAQLHQLRGRVGRGDKPSVCILLWGSSNSNPNGQKLGEIARKRLLLLKESNDGFAIAEADLDLRGAGEVLGTRQAGEMQMKIATPEHLSALLDAARDDAHLLIDRDGGLDSARGEAARTCLYLFEKDAAVGLLRGG
jgi:ATP-dependent DNA helicase RecG